MPSLDEILLKLKARLPEAKFIEGDSFLWSHKNRQITYIKSSQKEAIWSLLHEASHAILGHKDYETDFELVKLESEAWAQAISLGNEYDVRISKTYAEDCIDTYRDWLHMRSICPKCGNVSLQQDQKSYKCFNCATTWKVTTERLCRPYRLSKPATSSLPA